MILVAVVILVGVFWVATGRGGELAYEQADHAPLDLGPVSATDVALLRPPTALWGYNMQVTDEALEAIAQAVRDRDVMIAFLQQRLADLTAQTAASPVASPAVPPVLSPAAPLVVSPAAPAVVSSAAPPVVSSAAPEQPADPSGPADRAPAQPDDSSLAPEEQPR